MAQNETCVIGAGTRVTGRVTGSESLLVRGTVEGTIELGGSITVETGATVRADVTAARVTVRGTVEGSITAREAVLIESGARVTADVTTPRIAIQEGAMFRGGIEMEGPTG
jgi:cytoskeletal protein CcmA (bactofilin family)